MDDTRKNRDYIELLKKALTASLYDESAWNIVEILPVTKDPYSFSAPFSPIKQMLRGWLIRFLWSRNFLLVRRRPFDPEVREEGRDWPMFGFSMAGLKRLNNVEFCVNDVLERGVPGDLIETGAWRGGMTILMRALLKIHGCTNRKVWVADSFEGLPKPVHENDKLDISHVNHLKVSLEQVKDNFNKFGLLDDQVVFLKGWFSETLPSAPISKIAVLRLDGDYYSSTMDVLNNLYSKVVPGGYVIVDDYGFWPECKRAVTEYLDMKKLKPEIIQIDGSAVYWKVM